MRTIKFRGFNRKNNEWLHGFYLQNRGAHFVCPDEFATNKSWEDYEVDSDTVGQFTGLHDKDGKEIYEGDVVTCHHGGNYRIAYCCGEWQLIASDDTWLSLVEYDPNVSISNKLNSLEVIGNIHDNLELIGK